MGLLLRMEIHTYWELLINEPYQEKNYIYPLPEYNHEAWSLSEKNAARPVDHAKIVG